MKMKIIFCLLTLGLCANASASDAISIEPDGNSYHFVSHHEVNIAATARNVWPVLTDLGSWMYDFEMSSVSGEPGKQGEVLRLYPSEEFYVQITKMAPYKLLVVAKLPTVFQGESSTGISIITLHEENNQTTVSITSSRRYTGVGEEENQMMEKRASIKFQESNDAMQDRFFRKLKNLVENPTP